ncbi:serine aminopeptidase domain-containing protein [Thermosipho atlanticus]|uniref:Alpha/beta hydrolase family protein n=1 Tax=Thermosipho atlanticus DSM 15807 TaxID=1123380 RepID=A0A1M5RC56_9BACT|nr:alpha/beta hydrolase [Thermosipho atlanticus]SHH23851.1 Alpha/beta hydrolase family protein [Thermosipho atlanticus DSM 15807]
MEVNRKNTGKKLIMVSLILIILGSFLAQMFNTSFYNVKVTRIKFDTENGTLSGLLYMPKDANSSNPKPTIITTHGYLNSAEMQDAAAIEMSRRGFVVLALDMYEHGHSLYGKEYNASGAFFTFWPVSLYDAVQYMYKQDYVLKDENGNGIIGVAGHSMGGFSTTMAIVKDEQDFAQTGIRKIYAGLPMASDYSISSYIGVTADVAFQAYGPRPIGIVAAHYDDFFFDPEAWKTGETVVFKDYVKTAEGKAFLGNPPEPKQDTFYTLKNGALRVIFEPYEIHPWNHFSYTTTGHQIEFYSRAFAKYTDLLNLDLPKTNQIWFLKEYSEFLGLIGFFMLPVALILLLMNLPFFSLLKTKPVETFKGKFSKKSGAILWILTIFAMSFPALFFPTLMDKKGVGMDILKYSSITLMIASAIIGIIVALRRKEKAKSTILGTILIVLANLSLLLTIIYSNKMFKLSSYFNQPTTNQILYWAIVVAEVVLIIELINYFTIKKPAGASSKHYGFLVNPKSIIVSLITVSIAVFLSYLVLYIVDFIFKTDFRIWTWAIKTFETWHLSAALRYIPLYFIFYFVMTIVVNALSNQFKGWKGYLLAFTQMFGGLVVYLSLHYGFLFATGRAFYPDQSLTSILLFALIPTLLVATVYMKYLFKKTGNVYTAAFLNAILMTMIMAANTITYVSLK